MTFVKKYLWLFLIGYSIMSFSGTLGVSKAHEASVYLGGYFSSAGQNSNINIADMIGRYYSVDHGTGQNGLVGLGYFISTHRLLQNFKTFTDSINIDDHFNWLLGIETFYMGKVSVAGLITEEDLFTNYAYSYHISSFPLYASVKSELNDFKYFNNKLSPFLVAGIGVNFMNTDAIKETSLTDFSIPSQLFSGKSTANFSATAGAGFKIKNMMGKVDLDIGYRFFYLGSGEFSKQNNQIYNLPRTGSVYGNAMTATLTI